MNQTANPPTQVESVNNSSVKTLQFFKRTNNELDRTEYVQCENLHTIYSLYELYYKNCDGDICQVDEMYCDWEGEGEGWGNCRSTIDAEDFFEYKVAFYTDEDCNKESRITDYTTLPVQDQYMSYWNGHNWIRIYEMDDCNNSTLTDTIEGIDKITNDSFTQLGKFKSTDDVNISYSEELGECNILYLLSDGANDVLLRDVGEEGITAYVVCEAKDFEHSCQSLAVFGNKLLIFADETRDEFARAMIVNASDTKCIADSRFLSAIDNSAEKLGVIKATATEQRKEIYTLEEAECQNLIYVHTNRQDKEDEHVTFEIETFFQLLTPIGGSNMKTPFPTDNKEVVLLEGAFITQYDGQALRAMLYFWENNLPMTAADKEWIKGCKRYATAISDGDALSLEFQEISETLTHTNINRKLSKIGYRIGWYEGSLFLAQSTAEICKHFHRNP